jgi:hypothetical protein
MKVDELLSDYFKSKLRHPWPPAPSAQATEPSAPASRRLAGGRGGRSRFTLAASIALLIGICWYFSNGFQPTERPHKSTPAAPGILNEGSAKTPDEFKKTKKVEAGPMLD